MFGESTKRLAVDCTVTKWKTHTRCFVFVDEVLGRAIPIVVMNTSNGTVNGDLFKVGTTMAVDLSVKVRENATLK